MGDSGDSIRNSTRAGIEMRVRLLVSGPQRDGTFVSSETVRTSFVALAAVRSVGMRSVCGEVGEMSNFQLQHLEDGRVAITGRLVMGKSERLRRAELEGESRREADMVREQVKVQGRSR